MTKIEIKDLSILFGPEKAKAKKMIKQGKSKQEILKETGCTIAVRNANLEIKEGEDVRDNGASPVVVSRRWCVALTG